MTRKKHDCKHGMSGTPTYQTWRNMLARCYQPRTPGFKNYGGKGINVCDRWIDFVNFYADMGEKPSGDMSLDRIDPNKDYTPENCRWVSFTANRKLRFEKNRDKTLAEIEAEVVENKEKKRGNKNGLYISNLDADFLIKFKSYAALNGITIKDLVVKAIAEYVDDK